MKKETRGRKKLHALKRRQTMSVYVDEARHPFGRMLMCHMIADTTEELLAMADAIGVQRKWIQKAGTPQAIGGQKPTHTTLAR